ncbi:cell division cycle protein 27 homolog isoform X2 [Ornithodoros turicata]|uniref:cell division cycle protein 27 homolog isoform X2 n=1 Tax=Ornithodoros turicata TaxID=34597 RepID=UPI003139D569
MIVQEPVQAAIWHCLNHYAFSDAIFLAERLYAEVRSDESLHLLATCHYRAGNPSSAYSLLQRQGVHTPQARYLLARCCLDLRKFAEAELALLSGIPSASSLTKAGMDELASTFGDTAPFALALLGQLCARTERAIRAAEAHKKSLKLNPFLWSSFESLVNMGESPSPSDVFSMSSVENLSQCQGSNPLVSFVNKTNMDSITEDVKAPVALVRLGGGSNPSGGTSQSMSGFLTPEGEPLVKGIKSTGGKAAKSVFAGVGALTPLSPSFGVLPLNSPAVGVPSPTTNSMLAYVTPSPQTIEAMVKEPCPPVKKNVARKPQGLNPSKIQIFSQSGNNSLGQTPTASLTPGGLSSVRRSSRLFSSSNSVKENNKGTSSPKSSRGLVSKTQSSKKVKSPRGLRSTSGTPLGQTAVTEVELNEMNKSDQTVSLAHTALCMQKASAEGLMQLLQDLGRAQSYLGRYRCRQAVEALQALPQHHYHTGWVLAALGRAHFELGEYEQAVKVFEELRRLEPHRLQGLEYYSTALWHLQREVSLSSLAQDLQDMDKHAPETWCAAGNCFSLQREHETAIRFLQRAIQIDPDFAYAHTLLGHELAATEELDKAMSCFRKAILVDPRHYNAWYGIGMIYYKQERYGMAEIHFKRALEINPQSSVLLCHIGVVQHALKKTEECILTLDQAMAMDSRNPLCKFHRASIFFSLERYQDALGELDELKQIVPKESLVYFLCGKVHKKLGNTHLALMNFSWAMDLDPKAANNQIKESIDRRYTHDEEDIVAVHQLAVDDILGSMGSGPVDPDSSHGSSIADINDMTFQAMESDDGF